MLSCYLFALFFKKIEIISDVIIPVTAILKTFFYHFFFFFFFFFFCNITKYDCTKFHVKSIFLSGFTQCELYVPLPHPGHVRKNNPGETGLKLLQQAAMNWIEN